MFVSTINDAESIAQYEMRNGMYNVYYGCNDLKMYDRKVYCRRPSGEYQGIKPDLTNIYNSIKIKKG